MSLHRAIQSAVASILAVAVLLAGARATADEDAQSRARNLNNLGSAAYELSSYDEAIDQFSEAYKIYPDARILFNLAQAYRKKREYERALDLYRTYLRNFADAPNRKTAEELIGELEELIARQKNTDPRSSKGTTESPLAQLPPIITKIDETRPWYGNLAGWMLVGGGAISVGAGIGFFVSTSSLENELAVAADPDKAGLRSDISTRKTVGTILCVLGGLATAGGVAIFLFTPRSVTREIIPIRDLRLSLAPSQVALSWRF